MPDNEYASLPERRHSWYSRVAASRTTGSSGGTIDGLCTIAGGPPEGAPLATPLDEVLLFLAVAVATGSA